MAFTGRTPESLIPRSDSRNPATTCKGITKSGRPCRRPIDAKVSQDEGVIAVVSVISDDSGEEDVGAAAYFCWQHKDQAEQLAARSGGGPETQLFPLKERNSIDTLVERLGVLEVEEVVDQGVRRKRRESRGEGARPPRRIQRPPTWENIEGPLMQVPSDVMAEQKRRRTRPSKPAPQQEHKKKKGGFWAALCCGSADDEGDYTEVVRHKKRASHAAPPVQHVPEVAMQQAHASPSPPARVPQQQQQQQQSRRSSAHSSRPLAAIPSPPPTRQPLADKPARPLNRSARRESATTALLRYIPATLSPQLTSTLLAELSKPISPHDDEGYIYIFWLTPDALGPAPASTASNLLAPPSSSRPEQVRRTSEVLRQYSVRKPAAGQRGRGSVGDGDGGGGRRGSSVGVHRDAKEAKKKETILLKIGRANNVHRRMHEWTRQCGYSLSLVRYYPYTPSTSTPSPSPSPHASPATSRRPSYQAGKPRASDPKSADTGVRKVPHAHRVERLVHLELGAQRVVKRCEACGKEHREWFEVEASREGVRGVDEVVRRWVEWAERREEQ